MEEMEFDTQKIKNFSCVLKCNPDIIINITISNAEEGEEEKYLEEFIKEIKISNINFEVE